MRTYPEDLEDEEVKVLNAEEWQLNLLKLNPSYVHWGVYEDYMSNDKSGWDSRLIINSWDDFEISLDDYNEVVNFYFEVYREGEICDKCEGNDLNPETHQLSEDWYDFKGTGRKWNNKITKVEIFALMKSGRLADKNGVKKLFDENINEWTQWVNRKRVIVSEPTEEDIPEPEDINGKHDHDAINRWVCVEARAKHLGIYGKCEQCEKGTMYTEDHAKVALQLWVLHPRKGCSRGVYVKTIKQEDLPEVIKYLQEAAERNKDRFSSIVDYDYIQRDNALESIVNE